MNLSTLNEVADRKRMKSDVEKLREKISQENQKIIKLKVGQDTAYWELKEKLSSTERDHETLQRNMVQLQMAHESVSAQYQDELRHRPETLNKLASTREICDVLEENVSRVRASLQRSAADRAALADAYARAGAAVAAAHADNEKRLLAAASEARSARELARLSSEHGAQLMECASRERSRADQAAADVERLRDQRNAIADHLARRDTLLQEREKTIQELRNELRRVTTEFNERNERSRSAVAELEREAGAAAALRVALTQAEACCETASRESSRLASELTAEAAAKDEATQRIATLGQQIQEAQSHIEKMKEAMTFLVETGENLAKQLNDREEKIRSLEQVIADSQQEAHKLVERAAIAVEERERKRRDYEERETERERERRDSEELTAAIQRELTERTHTIDKLTCDIAEMKEAISRAEATISELTTQLENERGDNEKRSTATSNELTEYAATVTRLENNIAVETEAHLKADAALTELTAERERERRDYEKRVITAERELAERNDTIANLSRDLTEETETRKRLDIALAELTAERERERHDFEKRSTNTERELSKCNDTIAKLSRDLAIEVENRARVDTALSAARAELNTAREDAALALEDVRHLKADIRGKDDEAAKQMQIILSMRQEKEQMQGKIVEMQETINNIQEITRKAPAAAAAGAGASAALRRELPEHDDNAVAAPPTPVRGYHKQSGRASSPTLKHRKIQSVDPSVRDLIYNLFSDNSDSMEGGALSPREANRRFGALQSPQLPPVSEPTTKRRRHAATEHKRAAPVPAPTASSMPAPQPPAARPPASQTPASQPPASQPSASQPPARVSENVRKFFKSRRVNREQHQKK